MSLAKHVMVVALATTRSRVNWDHVNRHTDGAAALLGAVAVIDRATQPHYYIQPYVRAPSSPPINCASMELRGGMTMTVCQ